MSKGEALTVGDKEIGKTTRESMARGSDSFLALALLDVAAAETVGDDCDIRILLPRREID